MAAKHFRKALSALAFVLPEHVDHDDIRRLWHEIQHEAFWQALRSKYAGAETEWAQVQKKWGEGH